MLNFLKTNCNETLIAILNLLDGRIFFIGPDVYQICVPKYYYNNKLNESIRTWPDSNSYTVRILAFRKHWFWKWFPRRFYTTVFFEELDKLDITRIPCIKYVKENRLRLTFVDIGTNTLETI